MPPRAPVCGVLALCTTAGLVVLIRRIPPLPPPIHGLAALFVHIPGVAGHHWTGRQAA